MVTTYVNMSWQENNEMSYSTVQGGGGGVGRGWLGRGMVPKSILQLSSGNKRKSSKT